MIILLKELEEDLKEEKNNVQEEDKDSKMEQWRLILGQLLHKKILPHNNKFNQNNNRNNKFSNQNSKFNSLRILYYNNYSHNNCKGKVPRKSTLSISILSFLI